MKYFTIIGILLLIIVISLAIDYFLTLNDTVEGYQSFSVSQIQDMSQCVVNDPSCTFIRYYDASGIIKDGYFRNIPTNFYIDTSNILQPVPFGNIATPDKNGYIPKDKSSQYSTSQTYIQENAINPSICQLTDIDYSSTNPKTCYDASYIQLDASGNPQILKSSIRIPTGYYVNNGIVNKIPEGYVYENANDKTKIKMSSYLSEQISKTKYDTNNYSVQYHTDPTSDSNMSDKSSAGPGKMWVLDKSGNLVAIPYSDASNSTLYYEPGSFRFTSSNYVPNYEETVYLSKLTNISTVSPIKDATAMGGGFCDYYKNNPDELERMCNDQSGNTCASTSCCVLLGGQKCVYGNESGPKFKSNYSNFIVKNPEFYYYQGKCYGNCK